MAVAMGMVAVAVAMGVFAVVVGYVVARVIGFARLPSVGIVGVAGAEGTCD
jgi:hypothetical protein